MKKIVLFFILTIFSYLLFSCTPKSKKIPITDVWEHVKYQNESNKFEKVKEYEELLKNNPDSPEAYYLLSRCINDGEMALEVLKDGISKFPENTFILAGLGSYYINHNWKEAWDSPDWVKGKEYSEMALKSDGKNPLALYNLSRFYTKYNLNKNSRDESFVLRNREPSKFYTSIEKELNYYYKNRKKYLELLKNAPHFSIYIDENSINNQINAVNKSIAESSNLLENCKNRHSELEIIEINRINRMSYMSIMDSNVSYLGDCVYVFRAQVIDQMYGRVHNINIKYYYSSNQGWTKE